MMLHFEVLSTVVTARIEKKLPGIHAGADFLARNQFFKSYKTYRDVLLVERLLLFLYY